MTIKHRMSRTPEWLAWRNMRARCSHPKHAAYKNYGGRGIRVCPGWDTTDGGFDRFFSHVGPRPSDQHEIERIDNARGYEPGNVCWATTTAQARNRRTNRQVTIGGETHPLSAWAERAGLSAALLAWRIKQGRSDTDLLLPAGTNMNKPRGAQTGHARLRDEDIPEIRRRHRSGEHYPSIARAFGVVVETVRAVALGRTWRHVPDVESSTATDNLPTRGLSQGAGR